MEALALKAQLVSQEMSVTPEHREFVDFKEMSGSPERKALSERKAHKVWLVRMVLPDKLVRLAQKGLKGRKG